MTYCEPNARFFLLGGPMVQGHGREPMVPIYWNS